MLKHQRIAKSCLEIQKKFEEPKEDIDILDPDDLKTEANLFQIEIKWSKFEN